MKKALLTISLFIIGVGIGVFVKYELSASVPEEEKISDYNWISRYDFYDYEEAVLKHGDKKKMFEISCEAGVDRFPYFIVMYDVHKRDVCDEMLTFFNLYYEDCYKTNKRALLPLRKYLEKVIADTTESGFQIATYRLNEFMKNE